MKHINATNLKELISQKTERIFGIKVADATDNQLYKALCLVVRDLLTQKRIDFKKGVADKQLKRVYYMSMEFLLGRSLKNHLHNLKIYDIAVSVLNDMGRDISALMEIEPDAGLGNGGLGRLAAAFMDALTSRNYMATGFSIRYDYGIFAQRIVDGWQVEMPDNWLENGSVWLAPRVEDTFEVKFGGKVDEVWDEKGMHPILSDYTTILAIPYDMHVSGYDSDAVNTLRLWTAKAPDDFDLALFSRGEYVKAMERKAMAEAISKVLYPADDHYEGKSLRLKQQYFFVSASIQSILKKHIAKYGTIDNLGDKVAIHVNDTHPALCIPELMRILLDDYGYSWEGAWEIVTKSISYTNHTVMSEALERWPQSLFMSLLPRVYQIVNEINQRFCHDLWNAFPSDWDRVSRNAIVSHNEVRMANLCVAASHTVNGVSALHSQILKDDCFHDFYKMTPHKFTNVTNGITHRRWLEQANPELSKLIDSLIGGEWRTSPDTLEKLLAFKDDEEVIKKWATIKRNNKVKLAEYIKLKNGVDIDPDSIFDVQVKRLHEYKRQLLNAMHILDLYLRLKDNPDMPINPHTFIFGAKAAPSYYMAKMVIKFISALANQINNDASINGKIKVVFLENYCVTIAEKVMPASDVSEQISTAGKEASGTGNMKFMINGAITLGTEDGANVEIHERVGDDNIFIFGMQTDEVNELRPSYNPTSYYNSNPDIKRVIDYMREGVAGVSFKELADSLLFGKSPDTYMVLADFADYKLKHSMLDATYTDKKKWYSMSIVNTAMAGFFAADRSVEDYATNIWHLDKYSK